jgi:hypothetical protein
VRLGRHGPADRRCVEDGHDPVAREVLDHPARRIDGGHDRRPEGIEHLEDLGRGPRLAERGESGEIREHDAHDALLAGQGGARALAADALGND